MHETVQTPDWAKHAVFYQIFPDRFAYSPAIEKPSNLEPWDSLPSVFGFKGGDLLGVADHLDYLSDLGINAIYFNPIFTSASNHRYHTHDYYQVDPILGGNRAFLTLLKAAHARGIRVILDGVFNHASRGFFQFNHLLELGPHSPYVDWWDVSSFPLQAYSGEPNYACWANLPALPKFNTKNPQVRHFIFDVARYWIDQGIDGWRLDVPFEIDDDAFWEEFRQVVKSANPDAYLVGEIPWEASRWLQGDQFDAVMNYPFTQMCLGFFSGSRIRYEIAERFMGLPDTPILTAQEFAERALNLLHLYPLEVSFAQLNLLDSHDMPRFVAMSGGDLNALKLSVLFQMTYPGAPCVYYGDEIGMRGGQANYPEASRESFPWDTSKWDLELLDYYKQVIYLRHAHPALRTGEYLHLLADDDLYVFLRLLEDDALIVVLNASDSPRQVDIPVERLPEGSHWQAVFGKGEAHIERGRLKGPMAPPRAGIVLTPLN